MTDEEIKSKKQLLGSIIQKNRVNLGLSKRKLSLLSGVKYKYLQHVERGEAKLFKGHLFKILENLVLLSAETEVVFIILSQLSQSDDCAIPTNTKLSFHGNYSKRSKKVKATRKRSGTPIDKLAMRRVIQKNFNR